MTVLTYQWARTGKLVFFFILLSWTAFAQQRNVLPAFTLEDVAYGNDPLQKMDVSLVAGRNAATQLVVVVHGGGWMAGDKTDADFMKKGLNSAGINVVNINYRLANNTHIHYREIMQDMDAALRYVTQHARKWKIRSKRFVFWGGSAGGHLALLYAYGYDTRNVISAVISLGGPTKLNDVVSMAAAKKQDVEGLLPLITGEAYDRDSTNAAYIAASPFYGKTLKPALLVHGVKDDIVPISQSVLLSKLLSDRGIDHIFFPLPEGDHGGNGAPAAIREELNTTMLEWIRKYSRKRPG